jgi:hypothetical protein
MGKAESAITSYKEVKDKWYSYEQVTGILAAMPEKEELMKIMQATPEESRVALQKDWNGDYLPWLKNTINASDEDKQKLVQAKKKINSILPTMSPISGSIDEENITLKEYILFIEREILKRFELDSNMSLGIQGLTYGNAWNGIPTGIGTFDLESEFQIIKWESKRAHRFRKPFRKYWDTHTKWYTW